MKQIVNQREKGLDVIRRLAAAAMLLALFQAGTVISASAAETIKPGRWEFTSQMQLPGGAQMPSGTSLPPGVQGRPGGGMSATHTSCINPDQAVPTDPRPECRVERMQRNGATITWSASCTTGQGTVRSDGVAHYAGNAMEATLTTHVPGHGGAVMNATQRITGRYLGACTR
jgi:hypothetical protein